MNRLTGEKRTMIVASLVEGNSINATCRMAGVSKNTVLKLLGDLGLICSIHQDRLLRNLTCERVQVDEIWSFVYAKQKNVPAEKRGEAGDVWLWTAIDADTKLVPTYRLGPRDMRTAVDFIGDLEKRLANRIQLTSDGWHLYLKAVGAAFGGNVDYAMLQKVYGAQDDPKRPERRYSPAVCLDAIPIPVLGNPDPDYISTSHVERLNLTTRMSLRRYTRLTNGFSKKLENHAAAVSLHFMHYNFVRKHQTLKTVPAVAAGVIDKPWKVSDLVALLTDAENAVPMKRGPYKKQNAA
ncbi:MAG TPA: IS1 family transposase [Gaiellaceae bacterium]|nr:IS1 family transposase [Gaiellaceae bacterium]